MALANVPRTTHQWLKPLYDFLDTVIAVINAVTGSQWNPVRVLTAGALDANTWTIATQTKLADANGALTIDGVAMAAGDRFWDNHDAVGLRRGLFVVVSAGSGGSKWSVTRADDADVSADFTDGKAFAIGEGTSAGQMRQFTTNAPFVLDTDTPAIAIPADIATLTTAQTSPRNEISAQRGGDLLPFTTLAAAAFSRLPRHRRNCSADDCGQDLASRC
jgi:hypothetical protein